MYCFLCWADRFTVKGGRPRFASRTDFNLLVFFLVSGSGNYLHTLTMSRNRAVKKAVLKSHDASVASMTTPARSSGPISSPLTDWEALPVSDDVPASYFVFLRNKKIRIPDTYLFSDSQCQESCKCFYCKVLNTEPRPKLEKNLEA